VSIQPRASRR